MIPDIRDYDRLIAAFRWTIPARYNIGVDVCDRWARAEPDRPAILDVTADGRVDVLTYGGLREQSNRLANVLARRGVRRGDRVAVLLPQGAAVADRACGDLQARGRRPAARRPVRRRCAELPPQGRRRRGR